MQQPTPHKATSPSSKEAPTEVRRSTTPYSEGYEPILVITASSTGHKSHHTDSTETHYAPGCRSGLGRNVYWYIVMKSTAT